MFFTGVAVFVFPAEASVGLGSAGGIGEAANEVLPVFVGRGGATDFFETEDESIGTDCGEEGAAKDLAGGGGEGPWLACGAEAPCLKKEVKLERRLDSFVGEEDRAGAAEGALGEGIAARRGEGFSFCLLLSSFLSSLYEGVTFSSSASSYDTAERLRDREISIGS